MLYFYYHFYNNGSNRLSNIIINIKSNNQEFLINENRMNSLHQKYKYYESKNTNIIKPLLVAFIIFIKIMKII